MLQASCPGGMENESQKPQRNTSGRRADTYLGPGQNPNRLQTNNHLQPSNQGASPSQHRPVPDPPAALRLSAAASVTRQPQPTRYICHCEHSAAIPPHQQTPLMVNPSSHYLCLSLRECLVHSRQSRRSIGGVTHHQSRHRVEANNHSPRPHRPPTLNPQPLPIPSGRTRIKERHRSWAVSITTRPRPGGFCRWPGPTTTPANTIVPPTRWRGRPLTRPRRPCSTVPCCAGPPDAS